jgi:NADP-dependent 3-hydroxy acid dehydrogenase YdfG
VITVFSLWYIYHGMTRVRRKVLLGMREDLRRKHIRVTDPSVDPDLVEQGARSGPEGMGLENSSTDRMFDDDQYKK